jgi:4-hydroxythreonine-4-phosphate dehydrogenase
VSVRGVELVVVEQALPELGRIAAEHGRAAVAAAQRAVRAALAGDYAGVIGAPHTETAIHAAGIAFDGYPSFVARACGVPPEDAVLMLCFRHRRREVRIAHVTLHASVRSALESITHERVLKTVRSVHEALRRLGIDEPRIAVSGLNPHASESGAFGGEEIEVIAPALEAAKREGIVADGPIGADTLVQRKGYDAYVVMLHDQGHVAAKLLAAQRIAALTLGTPVLFSSVGHGSALAIAGEGRADASAMREAITRLVGRRRRLSAT